MPRTLPSELVPLESRDGRSRFVAERFAPYLTGSVLDVGCYEAPLRAILGQERYTGIDFVGDPDIELNLEQAERLPFDDRSFATVLCIDVLEHLENLHAMFDELVRVAAAHVILSLPNAWCDARRPIERGKGEFLHYGLPVEKPVDRHKWFFNATQAAAFIRGRAERCGVRVAELFVAEKPRPALSRAVRGLRFPGDRYLDRFGRTVWARLER